MYPINQQKPEKRITKHDGESLQVNSVFYTIQGEGPYSGKPAVFVRLAGCNLQCPGCDTKYTERCTIDVQLLVSWVTDAHNYNMEKDKIIVVITGGEPFRQNISLFCYALYDHGYKTIQVETNGTMPPSDCLPADVKIVCSPKTAKLNEKMLYRINHFKYVLNAHSVHQFDGLPLKALGNTATPFVARPPARFKGNVYVQPMDCGDEDVNKSNRRAVAESCLTYGYTAQLQIHKYLEVE